MHLLKLASVSFATLAVSATIRVDTQPPSLDRCFDATRNIDELLNVYAQYGDSWMGESRVISPIFVIVDMY